LIPGIHDFVIKMQNVLNNIESRALSDHAAMQRYLDSLQHDIDKYTRWFNELTNTIESLLDALQWPDIYVGATTFAGQGGNDLMVNSIGKALNSGDDTAPPFTKGTESVGGIVIMAGAESPGALKAFMTMMELLTGISFEANQTADTVKNAYNEAVEAVGSAIDAVDEQLRLLSNFSAAENSESSPEDPNPADGSKGFNAQMQAVTDGDTTCTGK
jgi:hypothetical protein